MDLEQIPLYIFAFVSVYIQVFLFMVLIEEWDKIFAKTENKKLKHFPKVVIAVPCWNEENTVQKTIESLLNLNYPKDKLQIYLVNDGSTDNTKNVLESYNDRSKYQNITVIHKENGGKHTAMNLILEKLLIGQSCEVFGCLDADSYVFPDTLQNMLLSFEEDKEVMATTPMLIVRKPVNFLQAIQSVEYNYGLLLKRLFGAINGIHVTPGPFSLFRLGVFRKIGLYKKAHNTEDMEITFRMQKNQMKITSSIDAYVETSTPNTVYKLYKQRLRWAQGFLQNSIDYKEILFKPKYGPVALITIPLGWFGMIMVIYLTFIWIFNLLKYFYTKINEIQIVGFQFHKFSNILSFDFTKYLNDLFLQTNILTLILIPMLIGGLIFMYLGHTLSLSTSRKLRYIPYFIITWSFLIPFWLARALWNTLFNTANKWR
jgi:cellulose synthase/poly-beta-1,6-N-acetylglucosamine synthase-like glycosyltransferase